MHAKAIELFQYIQVVHRELTPALDEAHEHTRTEKDLGELADIAYAMREIAKFADEIRKQADKVQDTAGKLACLYWSEAQEMEPIKTKHCTGTPDVGLMVSIPNKRKDPENYAAFIEWLGIPRELAVYDNPEDRDEHKPVDLHYNGVCEYLTKRLAAGGDMPPGIDIEKTYSVFKLKIRKKKAVDSGVANANPIV